MNKNLHDFHIPVLGVGFSIDTPVKVAKYNISSVISLLDDELIEIVRKYYCEKYDIKYYSITNKHEDRRAKRITEYLNLINTIINRQIEEVSSSEFENGSMITKYFNLLPDTSPVKKAYREMLNIPNKQKQQAMKETLRQEVKPGSIEVNIMVKLDRDNYARGEKLPPEYSDAMAALRGYANSDLASSVVFSAGFNRRLFSYLECFDGFFANNEGLIKKKIILKVNDYRSALTQAKALAKKGLWVSEYRIESGLNCGGHVFPTNGYLLGPILEEFKENRDILISDVFNIYNKALITKNKKTFEKPHSVKFSVQGGVGTAKEHNFLLKFYKLDCIGWGSPFLLVPQVMNVDPDTLSKLTDADEENIFLSDISPLNVLFYTLKNSCSELEKIRRIKEGIPGAICTKSYLANNTEFSDMPICIASRVYQKHKLKSLQEKHLSDEEHEKEVNKVVVKACICKESSDSVRINYNLNETTADPLPCVCPGPNLAFFNRITTLEEMVNYIYGRKNIFGINKRPHVFLYELKLYIKYFETHIKSKLKEIASKKNDASEIFRTNLLKGIDYYKTLIFDCFEETEHDKKILSQDLMKLKDILVAVK